MKKHEIKTFQRDIEVKSIGEDGTFEGYASVYGNIDLGNDIIKPGAFTKTLQEGRKAWPVLDEHSERVGAATLEDTAVGLKAMGRLNLNKQAGRDAYADLKFYQNEGMQMGMSIGYIPINGKVSTDEATGARVLGEVKLFEVTLTMIPMNELARVTQVKSIESEYEFAERIAIELKAGRKISKADEARLLAIHNEIASLLQEAGVTITTATSIEEPEHTKSVEPDYHSLLSIFDKFSLTEGVR